MSTLTTASAAAAAAAFIPNIVPAAADNVLATMRNTTAGWKKERVRPLSETLVEQTGVLPHASSLNLVVEFVALGEPVPSDTSMSV